MDRDTLYIRLSLVWLALLLALVTGLALVVLEVVPISGGRIFLEGPVFLR
jgi:hypothetical protein